MSDRVVLIAGGGTGGHVFPGIAIAEAMQSLADVDVIFCGTARGLEARIVPERGFRLEQLDVEPIVGGGPGRALRGAFIAARATAKSLLNVRGIRPRAVLSVGGYAAGPASLAAAMSGVPLAVVEPNSVAGVANRLLAPFARRAYVAWRQAGGPFRKSAVREYGVPIRSGFSRRPYRPQAPRRILVIGGSQGSEALNERMPSVVAMLARSGLGVGVLHQAGRGRDEAVREAYDKAGADGVAVVPFIDDMAQAIANADIVICRAGACTLAEVTAIGRASILVPFPQAAGNHQAKNAEVLAHRGAAVCVAQADAHPTRLAAEAERLLRNDVSLVAMAAAAASFGRPVAAYDVAADLLALARVPLREVPKDDARHSNGIPLAAGRPV